MCLSMQQYVENSVLFLLLLFYFILFYCITSVLKILFHCPNLCLYKKASVEQKAFNFKIVEVHNLLERHAIFKTHMKNLNRRLR